MAYLREVVIYYVLCKSYQGTRKIMQKTQKREKNEQTKTHKTPHSHNTVNT